MPVAPEAILQDQEGRAVLRFERSLPHPPERVWQALTAPADQSGWHPTPFESEPTVGGTVSYLPSGDIPDFPDGEITEYEPPRVLAHSWGEDQLRWEITPRDGGCLLVLTHTFDDRFKAARDAAGWHVCLDALSKVLDEAPTSRYEGGRVIQKDWPELNTAYEKRFGIPREKATPPPDFDSSH